MNVNKLSDFVEYLINKYMQETEDDLIWDMWLHKEYEKSFNDFKNSIDKSSDNNFNSDASYKNSKDTITLEELVTKTLEQERR